MRIVEDTFKASKKDESMQNDILPEIAGINISSNKFSDIDRTKISNTIKRLANGDEYASTDAIYYRDSGLDIDFEGQSNARKSVIAGIKSALKANNVSGVRVTTAMEKIGRDLYGYWVTIKPTGKFRVGGKKEVDESLNESNDEDMGYKLGKWLGARLLTGWTAMLNVDGAEESPYYDEYDQQFDGTFVQCLNKLKEYQNIIDRDGIDAYLALQSSHGEYFDGDYDNIIDKLYDRGYLYDDDIDESLEESFNVSDETIEDAVEYYRENAFGFNGLKNYVETDFSHLPKEARDEIYKKMKKKLGESLNESRRDYGNSGYSPAWQSVLDELSDRHCVFGSDRDFTIQCDTPEDAEECAGIIWSWCKSHNWKDGFDNAFDFYGDNCAFEVVPEALASYGYFGESLNENCNSYQYKGKTIINAGDYWFVKGYKEKFPTSDEAEEFIDDKKKDEGVNINIRESLNKMDAESDNTYDLLNLYESKSLSRKQKKDIARMIYENYGLERIYNYLYEATEESEDELPVEDRVKELTNDFKNTNGSYVFEDGQDANKAVTILKSRGYDASQKRTQDGKYRVTANKK